MRNAGVGVQVFHAVQRTRRFPGNSVPEREGSRGRIPATLVQQLAVPAPGRMQSMGAPDLGAAVIRETLRRAGLSADRVQALVMATSSRRK